LHVSSFAFTEKKNRAPRNHVLTRLRFHTKTFAS
jgi:hypothetical protein